MTDSIGFYLSNNDNMNILNSTERNGFKIIYLLLIFFTICCVFLVDYLLDNESFAFTRNDMEVVNDLPVKIDAVVTTDGSSYIHYASSKDLQKGSMLNLSQFSTDGENGTLGQVGWLNGNPGILSSSIERNEPISGNASLRVDIKPADINDERVIPSWSNFYTSFIPVNNDTIYNFSLSVSAKDVNKLHSIVYYYDSLKTQIERDFIFQPSNGTFKKEFSRTSISPSETKYAKIQMMVRASIGIPSYFLIDDLKVVEIAASTKVINR